MQAHEWGKYVGRAQFDYQNGKLTLTQYDLIPVNLKNADGDFIQEEIVKDPELYNTLLTYQEKGQQELGVVIGATDGVLDGERANVRNKQTNLGRLITTATAEKLSTDFGIVNSGGVRASIAAGDISYRDVLTVHPFGNTVNKATMSGNELLTYLGQVATKTANTGGYAQFGGIKMTVDCQAKSVDIATIGGKAFDPAATYSFSIPSFSAAGGDGYPKIDTISRLSAGRRGQLYQLHLGRGLQIIPAPRANKKERQSWLPLFLFSMSSAVSLGKYIRPREAAPK